jgi:hypothetical protein
MHTGHLYRKQDGNTEMKKTVQHLKNWNKEGERMCGNALAKRNLQASPYDQNIRIVDEFAVCTM